MDELLKPIRAWLSTQRGNWNSIARHVGLSEKTLKRIRSNKSYSISLKTYAVLKEQINGCMNSIPKGKGLVVKTDKASVHSSAADLNKSD